MQLERRIETLEHTALPEPTPKTAEEMTDEELRALIPPEVSAAIDRLSFEDLMALEENNSDEMSPEGLAIIVEIRRMMIDEQNPSETH